MIRSLQGVASPKQVALRNALERWVRDALAAGLDADSVEAMFESAMRSAQEEGVA